MIELKNSRLFVESNYVGGAWIEGARRTEVIDPATNAIIASVPDAGADEARAAIAAAHAAFPAWRAKTASERATIMRQLAALVTENAEDLARILTSEQGKPLSEARGEIAMWAAYILWFAVEARRIYGDIVP